METELLVYLAFISQYILYSNTEIESFFLFNIGYHHEHYSNEQSHKTSRETIKLHILEFIYTQKSKFLSFFFLLLQLMIKTSGPVIMYLGQSYNGLS